MKKILTIIPVLILLISSCSKKESTTSSVADEFVGNWNVKDSLVDGSNSTPISSYSISMEKKDATHVYVYNFEHVDTAVFSVSTSSFVYVSGGSGSSAFTLSVTDAVRNGNKIYFTQPATGPGGFTRGVISKL